MKPLRGRDIRGPVIVLAAIALCALLFAQKQFVQQQPPPAPPPPQSAVAGSTPPMTPQQLDDLTAPVALYPDTLLSQILVASTYPLEVVEAQQWLSQHQNLKDKKLMEEAQHQNWDPSVQALVAFPGVLARLNQDVRWTTDLGNAFLAQQADVMASVQRLRWRARDNGKLQPGPQENITTSSQNGQSAVQIQPANPEDVYVPDYNPAWAWGPPVYGAYPPLLYPPIDAGLYFDPVIDLGFYFGGGWGLWGGFGWGWGPDWFGGGIFLNVNFFHRFGFRDFHPGLGGGSVWMHDPAHRLGVPYASRAVANRFHGAEGIRGAAAIRGNAGGNAAGFRAAPNQRFGTQGFERQNSGGNQSAFGGIRSGSAARVQSDHGFSSMGHAGFSAGGFLGGCGFGGGLGGGGRR